MCAEERDFVQNSCEQNGTICGFIYSEAVHFPDGLQGDAVVFSR